MTFRASRRMLNFVDSFYACVSVCLSFPVAMSFVVAGIILLWTLTRSRSNCTVLAKTACSKRRRSRRCCLWTVAWMLILVRRRACLAAGKLSQHTRRRVGRKCPRLKQFTSSRNARLMGLLQLRYEHDSTTIRVRYNIVRGVMCFRAIMNMSILSRCYRML